MKTIIRVTTFVVTYILFFSLASCDSSSQKKDPPVFIDENNLIDSNNTSENSNNLESNSENVVSVPFRQESGVKYIAVTINGMKVDMIFDTGCSAAMISVAEANYLYSKGALSENDIIGSSNAQIADGRIVQNMVVNLREVVVGEKLVCPNVKATVSENPGAPLLLGNDILDRAASYSIDNERQCIDFTLK